MFRRVIVYRPTASGDDFKRYRNGGYWQVSASCGVTATDTKTNQYWTGSAGPPNLTSYTLDITYTSPVVCDPFSTDGGAGLDAKAGQVFYAWNPADGDIPFKTDDSPEAHPLDVINPGVASSIIVANHATMWFMYKPGTPGSIWVPIDSVNWNWSGQAIGPSHWILTNYAWSQNPTGAPTDTYPEWDGYRNLTPTPAP